ncbi:MAG: hypothetical protein ACXACX_09290, partial [Candidatus Hodarchaeales archaeon]
AWGLADALGSAASQASNISVPSGGGIPGMAVGGIAKHPMVATIGEAGPEVVTPVKALFGSLANVIAERIGGGGRQTTVNMGGVTNHVSGVNDPEAIVQYLEENQAQSLARVMRKVDEGGFGSS